MALKERKRITAVVGNSPTDKNFYDIAENFKDNETRLSVIESTRNNYQTTSQVLKTTQTFNSTTGANVVGLSFPVKSARFYLFRFLVVVSSDTATVGPALGLTFPQGVETFACNVKHMAIQDVPTGAGPDAEDQGQLETSGDMVVAHSSPAANTNYLSEIRGILVTGNGFGGTLQVIAAVETTPGVLTVRRGSVGFLQDMGSSV